MKNLSIILVLTGLLLCGCGSKELTKEEALVQLQKDKRYPRVIDYDIFTKDPVHAKRALDKGLETAGLVTIQKTQTLREIGNPFIFFTEKAKPFFLPAVPGQDASIQKVKVAEERITEITKIVTDTDNKTGIVDYTTTYSNQTPFAVLLNNSSQNLHHRTAYFTLTDQGWILQQRKR